EDNRVRRVPVERHCVADADRLLVEALVVDDGRELVDPGTVDRELHRGATILEVRNGAGEAEAPGGRLADAHTVGADADVEGHVRYRRGAGGGEAAAVRDPQHGEPVARLHGAAGND